MLASDFVEPLGWMPRSLRRRSASALNGDVDRIAPRAA
jgi:hypothetical protein